MGPPRQHRSGARGDTLILSGRAGGAIQGVRLYERTLETGDPWLDRPLSTLSTGTRLIILVRRGGDVLIPKGDTVLLAGDTWLLTTAGFSRRSPDSLQAQKKRPPMGGLFSTAQSSSSSASASYMARRGAGWLRGAGPPEAALRAERNLARECFTSS